MRVFQRHWRAFSKDEINQLPLQRYEGPIHLIRSENELELALETLEKVPLIGFDTETRPAFKKNQSYLPSLLQLATSDAVYVIQLQGSSFSEALRHLLSNPAVIKAGIAVQDDLAGLKKLAPFEEAGFIDLGQVTRRLGIKTNGLRNLSANFLGARISKQSQRSNWGRWDLSTKQINYAATDAWASREIYLRFKTLGIF